MHEATIAFVLAHRRGIWRVTKDGVFYGDYRTKTNGTEAVEMATSALRQAGRSVSIACAPTKDTD